MKVFMGMHNIASLMQDYAAGFRALGHEVFCVADSDIAIRNADVDLNIPRMTAAKLARLKQATREDELRVRAYFRDLAWQKALEADICFFIWESFRPDASDLPALRKMGKKIVVRFCGSDVRHMEAERQAAASFNLPYTDYGLDTSLASFTRRLHYLRMSERYAHLLINAPLLSLRPASARAGCIFQPESPLCDTNQRRRPVILHAPSQKTTKGTSEWLQIFAALRSAGLEFGVKMVEGLPHEEMTREYLSADIFCNSLFYGGRAAYEAMAAGCVVVSSSTSQAMHEYSRKVAANNLRGLGLPPGESQTAWWLRTCGDELYCAGHPIVEVQLETACTELAALIMDWPRRQALAEQGPIWVKKALSPSAACREILDQVNNAESLEMRARLFWSPFFNLEYMPERDTEEHIALFNKYTALVRPCRWYKDYVIPCERGGLRF